jgi:hypothetical protein
VSSLRDVDDAVDAIRAWGERCDWTGWDPYDALTSPHARLLSADTPFGRRALTQLVKTSPVNLRPALQIPKARNAKAMALVVSAYARLAAARDDEGAAEAARRHAVWLAGAARDGGWGYHFDVQTRFFAYAAQQPNVVATAFAGQALLDALALGADVAPAIVGAAELLVGALLRGGPRPYFRYVAGEDTLVHNANVLACAFLTRAAHACGRDDLAAAARAPLETTLLAQRPDGSWPYAEGATGAWVDNFHTGYVLESIAACEPIDEERLRAGVAFWEERLFTPLGVPRANAGSTYPVDAHSYAQAIETWLALGRPDRAEPLARDLVAGFLEDDGHVAFEIRRRWTNRVPFVRWTTAPAFRALARLLLERRRVGRAHLD